jgi:hypothetical protein
MNTTMHTTTHTTTHNTTHTRLMPQFSAFVFAVLVTGAMLAGIGGLADSLAPHALLAQTTVPAVTAAV